MPVKMGNLNAQVSKLRLMNEWSKVICLNQGGRGTFKLVSNLESLSPDMSDGETLATGNGRREARPLT